MKTKHGVVIRYGLLAIGIFIGISILTWLDIHIRTNEIDSMDPNTWPKMVPGIEVFFIPLFMVIHLVVLVPIDIVVAFLTKRQPSALMHWLYLGILYSAPMSVLPLMRLGLPLTASLVAGVVLTAILPLTFRQFIGERPKNQDRDIL